MSTNNKPETRIVISLNDRQGDAAKSTLRPSIILTPISRTVEGKIPKWR
jgi:hypothetical protein